MSKEDKATEYIKYIALITSALEEEIGPRDTCAVLAGFMCGISETSHVEIDEILNMITGESNG